MLSPHSSLRARRGRGRGRGRSGDGAEMAEAEVLEASGSQGSGALETGQSLTPSVPAACPWRAGRVSIEVGVRYILGFRLRVGVRIWARVNSCLTEAVTGLVIDRWLEVTRHIVQQHLDCRTTSAATAALLLLLVSGTVDALDCTQKLLPHVSGTLTERQICPLLTQGSLRAVFRGRRPGRGVGIQALPPCRAQKLGHTARLREPGAPRDCVSGSRI